MALPPPTPGPRPAKPPAAAPPEAASGEPSPFAPAGRTAGTPPRTNGERPTARGRETAAERQERRAALAEAQQRALRGAQRRNVLFLLLFGGAAYLFGWYARYYGTIPGVFLASDIGVPVVLVLAIAGVARIMRRGMRPGEQSRAAAALARGGGWALGAFWAIWTVTTVPQLALGLTAAILAFALFWSRDRRARAGHTGFGPSFAPVLVLMAGYPVWVGAERVMGTAPFFDLASALAVFVFAFIVLRRAGEAARAADQHVPDPAVVAQARQQAAGSARATRLVLVLVVGYLFFTFFISPVIPYGPIVEWFIIALAPLLFALVVANRVGTVPTRRALPPFDVRTHEQRVYSLPDHHLADIEAHLAAYVHHNRERDAIVSYAGRLLAQAGARESERREVLDRLAARRSNQAERRAALARMLALLDEVLPEKGKRATDILKTNRPVARNETGWLRVPD